jgi:hypothetical protein
MRIPSCDPPRRPATRMVCRIALALALAHGTTGCAHQQITDTEFMFGAAAVAGIVAGALLMTSECNELTTRCRPGEGRIIQLAPSPSAALLPAPPRR